MRAAGLPSKKRREVVLRNLLKVPEVFLLHKARNRGDFIGSPEASFGQPNPKNRRLARASNVRLNPSHILTLALSLKRDDVAASNAILLDGHAIENVRCHRLASTQEREIPLANPSQGLDVELGECPAITAPHGDQPPIIGGAE